MPSFLVQGLPQMKAAIANQVILLGGHIDTSLDNLASLADITLLVVNMPPSANEMEHGGLARKALLAIPGVYIVEDETYLCFHTLGPANLFPGHNWLPTFPIALPQPNDGAAVLLQLLPPEVSRLLPPHELLSIAMGYGLPKPSMVNLHEQPFGVPGLLLGPAVSSVPGVDQDLRAMLENIQIPQAQALNLGEGAIVGVIDSGINGMWVSPSQRVAGWSEDGDDPWADPLGHGSMVAGILMAAAPKAGVISCKVSTSFSGGMSSIGIYKAIDFLTGQAIGLNRPIICQHSWGVPSPHNLLSPCSTLMNRAHRLLDERNLMLSSWAAGNNRGTHTIGQISNHCANSCRWAISAGALDRNLRPQFYSSQGGQCYPFHPSISATTFGVLPWGSGWMDLGEKGGATSSCCPQTSATLAMMMTAYPNREFAEYRAALRGSARNDLLGILSFYDPATGSGLIQADRAIELVPKAKEHPWYAIEKATPTSVARLGEEPERG